MEEAWDWVIRVVIGSGVISGGIFGRYLIKILMSKFLRLYVVKGVGKLLKTMNGQKPQTHKIFDSLEDKLFEIKETKLSTPLKTKLYITVLTNKVETVIDYTYFWTKKNQKDFKNWDNHELRDSMIKLIPQMIKGSDNKNGYEDNILRELKRIFKDDSKAQKYYKVVYLDSFEQKHARNINYINHFFENFFIYRNRDNYHLIDEFLDRINSALIKAIADMKDVISELNGELEEI